MPTWPCVLRSLSVPNAARWHLAPLHGDRFRGHWRGSGRCGRKAVAAGTEPGRRATLGGDERVIVYIARLLAEAVKDRSADHLVCSARSYTPWEEAEADGGITVAYPPSRLGS